MASRSLIIWQWSIVETDAISSVMLGSLIVPVAVMDDVELDLCDGYVGAAERRDSIMDSCSSECLRL